MAWYDGVRRALGFKSRAESGASDVVVLPRAAATELALTKMVAPHLVNTRAKAQAFARGWSGEKFRGGIWDNVSSGQQDWTDYETLRSRSEEVFQRNVYARGLIRRLVTNIIHTGLQLESDPVESILGREPDSMLDWAEDVEVRFKLWGDTARVCCHKELMSFGKLQALVLRESIIGGDCLVILRQNKLTKLPTVEIVSASSIIGIASRDANTKNNVDFGVERDAAGRHVAYHVQDFSTGEFRTMRIPARDSSGRLNAWMVYGNDRRTHTVRGEPLLSTILQSLKEVDKYRDSVQRKAVVNSILAMFIRKDLPGVGTLPLSNAATSLGFDEVGEQGDSGEQDSREFNIANQVPGVVIEELNAGEVPVGFDNKGVDVSFGEFEGAMLSAMAWSLEVPPEIAVLSFNSNYSASQAALNEFRIVLTMKRKDIGQSFCQPVYAEWLLSEGLRGRIDIGNLPNVFADPAQFDTTAAWVQAEWAGAIKPTTDPKKQVEAMILAIDAGLTTRALSTKELNGRKFATNMPRLKRENEALADAKKSLEPEPAPGAFGESQAPPGDSPGEQADEESEEETETDEE